MLAQGYSVAELVIMGFQGKSLSPETVKTIAREKPTQFILFAHNYESKEQLIALNDEIQHHVSQYRSSPAIISADQEGGRVARFRKDFTILPPALTVGNQASPHIAFDLAKIQARELFAAGINLNYAPVCDVNTNPANPTLGDRAFGETVEQVTRTASAVVRGHLAEGVQACIKHFPGHGDTQVDSHESLPTVTTSLEVLRTREWIPFRKAMKAGSNFVMSAHILMPNLDPNFPATFSPTFLKTYLRGELMFQGAIISDDLEMGAVVKNYGAEEAPILALKAGCDLLCYRSEIHAVIAIEAIKKALQDKILDGIEIQRSIDRVRKIRSSLTLPSKNLSLAERLACIGNSEHQEFVKTHFA
jgi:beta-N-acetylhexosaminidase